MKTVYLTLSVLITTLSLAACSTLPATQNKTTSAPKATTSTVTTLMEPNHATNGSSIAGHYEKSMDELDKSKMSRAMDSALGKATHWVNASTGLEYTVVPLKKVKANGNPLCREYNTTIARGANAEELHGIACIGSDGNWHAINQN